MENTIFSLLPPLLAIVMVILTKRVLLSLGVGIISAAILLSNFNISETISIILVAIKDVFVADGALNTWNVYIILFLFILGIITAFITITGGSRAFGEWAIKRVKTRKGSQFVTAILGIIIFIDDYFNSLAVGQVSRPITDRQKVSRAKLAYLIDSTSAPICVISPVSSWGAYIISLLGTIFATHQITEHTALSAFVQMIPLNLYVWAAIPIVFIVIAFNFNYGSMKVHEERAVKEGILSDPEKSTPGELKENLPVNGKGEVGDLIWPILTLMIATVTFFFITGYMAAPENATIFTIFENTDVSASLLYGGLIGLAVALILFFRHTAKGKEIGTDSFIPGVIAGIKSMVPAVNILLFAWVIADLIGQLETGSYLAGIVDNSSLSISYLPFILFIVAGIMAFSTGTSWGSFGILLPIAAEIAVATDLSILLPAMSAVLAGAVLGDHSSPISDTTILSSTGAQCNIIDHVLTQLPYALTAAGIAASGYLVYGLLESMFIAFIVVIIMLIIYALIGKRKEMLNTVNG